MEKQVRGHITQVDEDFSEMKKEGEFIRLDVACGNNKQEGFIGLDISENTQADWLCNLNYFPWQYKEIIGRVDNGLQHKALAKIEDNSISEIFCSHYIEHAKDIRKFAQELYRICKNGARVTFLAPYYSSIRAMQDPTHVNFISEATFLYWNADWMKQNGLQHYDMNCDFQVLSIKYMYHPDWNMRADAAKEWARKHNINVVTDIEAILQVRK